MQCRQFHAVWTRAPSEDMTSRVTNHSLERGSTAAVGAAPRAPRSQFSRARLYDLAAVPSYALNFYSPIVADQLKSGRKTATIRLGDKSRKYEKGMIVSVLCGTRFGTRDHVFDAVIDKVDVKPLGDLSPREIEHDNPEIKRADDMAHFLGTLYNRQVTGEDLVTVIRFSPIR